MLASTWQLVNLIKKHLTNVAFRFCTIHRYINLIKITYIYYYAFLRGRYIYDFTTSRVIYEWYIYDKYANTSHIPIINDDLQLVNVTECDVILHRKPPEKGNPPSIKNGTC